MDNILRAPRRASRLAANVLGVALAGFAFALVGLFGGTAFGAERVLGPFGPEGPRLREQLWVLPSHDPKVVLRATVFRPNEAAGGEAEPSGPDMPSRHPLVVINHGTDEASREAVSLPVFYWLSRWFVEHGYVVVLPQRRGHGATGGELAEAVDTCLNPDHYRAGQTAADDIEAALDFMTRQTFVDPARTVVVGISTGGWASLALAARNPPNVHAIINFAGGRGAFAGGRANAICGAERLVAAAGAYAREAKTPTLWLYSRNDRYFGPDIATRMAGAWTENGGSADLRLLPAFGKDGHALADDRAGWRLWGSYVEKFLERHREPLAASGADAQASLAPEPVASR